VERLRLAIRWKLVVIVSAMALGLFVWRVDAIRTGAGAPHRGGEGQGLPGSGRGLTAIQPNQAPDQQAMFDAVKRLLESAHVAPQDMPRKIITVTPVGTGHYHVHMEMVQGDGWFDLMWDGKTWQVKGMSAPR
jgi:hypothetical protein